VDYCAVYVVDDKISFLLEGAFSMKNELKRYEIDWGRGLFPEFWEKFGEEGVFPQQMFDVSDEALDQYYEVAVELLHENAFKEAKEAFTFLTFLNPSYQSFWMGLGIALQSLGEFENAVQAYGAAVFLNPLDPIVHLNRYQCLVALGNHEEADISYEVAMEVFEKDHQYDEFKSKLLHYKEKVGAGHETKK
jgi:type III secretion system low calcium response chaperone LcrH/SycD